MRTATSGTPGRADDVIIAAGYRIGPFEVESACIEHPAVREAAAVASPDEVKGHVVKAFIVLAEGHEPSDELAKDIQGFVRDRLSAYAYPRRIEFTDELPKTLTGQDPANRIARGRARARRDLSQFRYSEYVNAPDHEAAVIGAGFSGLGAAIKLDDAGISDYVVLEAGDGIGGTWHWNTYPGVAVDIPSFSYQFSFEKRANWSRVYAPGPELKGYAEHLADKYRLRSRIRLNTKIVSATYDGDAHLWRLETESGDAVTARFLIGATGVLQPAGDTGHPRR